MLRKSKCQFLYPSHMLRGSAEVASLRNNLAISSAKAGRIVVIASKASGW